MKVEQTFAIAGTILAGLGVITGAFGAHGLKRHFALYPEMHPIYHTAVEYHLIHALGLIGAAYLCGRWPGGWMTAGGALLVIGIMIFSGSLYTLSLTRQKWLGAVTPLGGMALILGWLSLAVGVWRGGR